MVEVLGKKFSVLYFYKLSAYILIFLVFSVVNSFTEIKK